MNIERKIDFSSLILILSVSAVIAYGYFGRVDRPNFELRLELHNQIITGTAPSPYRYRILVPFAGEILTRTLLVILPMKAAFLLSYAIYDLTVIFFLLAVLFLWLRTWFNMEQALIGVLFIAVMNKSRFARSIHVRSLFWRRAITEVVGYCM